MMDCLKQLLQQIKRWYSRHLWKFQIVQALFEDAGITIESNPPLNKLKEVRFGMVWVLLDVFITEGRVGKRRNYVKSFGNKVWFMNLRSAKNRPTR